MNYRIVEAGPNGVLFKAAGFSVLLGYIFIAASVPAFLTGLLMLADPGIRGLSTAVFGGAVFLFFAGKLVGRAMRSAPKTLEFSNREEALVLKSAGGTEARLGYGEIAGFGTRYVNESGHLVFMEDRDGCFWDLCSFGYSFSKKPAEILRILEEKVRYRGSDKKEASALPSWVSREGSASGSVYSWDNPARPGAAVGGLACIAGFLTAILGVPLHGFYSRAGGFVALAVAGIIAAVAVVTMARSKRRREYLALSSGVCEYGFIRTRSGASREGREMVRKAAITPDGRFSASLDGILGGGQALFFMPKAALTANRRRRLDEQPAGELIGLLRDLSGIFQVGFPGLPSVEILRFARFLEAERRQTR